MSVCLWVCLFSFWVNDPPFGLIIHGGAGTIERHKMSADLDAEYRRALKTALAAGYEILQKGGSCEAAAIATIKSMEDSPLFNAGRGAVFTNNGKNEFDASIMLGTGEAGACAGVRNIKNPILLAQAVMNSTPHVMLAGDGAVAYARELGLEFETDSYFFTEKRWKQLKKAKVKEKEQSHDNKWRKFGTVGVVALDKQGHMAAATSTGGLTNKQFGRIGDSPIIGAGTYCDNETCGVSGTGQGEFFMRSVVAYDVAALIKYKGMRLQEAVDEAIRKLSDKKGSGGLIAMNTKAEIAFSMNTKGMYRGYRISDGRHVVQIYGDEH